MSLIINLAQSDLEWSLDFFDVLNFLNSLTNSGMNAKNFVVSCFVCNYRCKRHLLKHVIDFLEDAIRVGDVLPQTSRTLLTESKILVDISVFVISAKKENLLRKLQFQCHKQADNFKTLATFVNIVSKEQVVKSANVSIIIRHSPDVKETHQIDVVSMDVSENLDRGL